MKKYIDAEKLIELIDNSIAYCQINYSDDYAAGFEQSLREVKNFIDSLQQEQDMGEVSDGYHTFNELYYYRMLYNAAFFNLLPKEWVHKSKRHHTGEECFGGGWFIVMANLPTGQVSNHYELKDWDLFKVPEKEFADEWDGHTPQEAAERIHKYLQQEQPSLPSNLEEAAEEYEDWAESYSQSDFPTSISFRQSFKAGAEWMAKQFQREQPEVDLVAELKHHLATTPKEQLEKEWKELEPWGNIGPTVQEFLYGKQPEVDLEKEIDTYTVEQYHETFDETGTFDEFDWEDIASTIEDAAHHFYELGLKVRKED